MERRAAACGGNPEVLINEALVIHAQDLAMNHAIGDAGAAVVPDNARILTHCNAGSLATGGYGTALGVIAGNLLPVRVVSALSVALFGMFLAVIIPPAKKDKIIAGLIIICFATGYAATLLPILKDMTDGTRTIILTVVIASLAAILFPREVENKETQEETP